MSGNQGTADAMMQAQLEAEVIYCYNMLCIITCNLMKQLVLQPLTAKLGLFSSNQGII